MKVPQLRDELERKTVETLEWIIERASSGQMTPAETKVAIQTTFSVVSGLVGKDIMSAMETVEADPLADTVIRRVFTKEGTPKMFVASWRVGSKTFRVTGQSLAGTREIKHKDYEFDDPRTAQARFESICQHLRDHLGLEEIE